MSKSVIIVGVGGHGRVVADIVCSSGDRVIGFLDDAPKADTILGFPVLGRCADYVKFPDAEFIIGIGNTAVRERLAAEMEGVKWYTAVHPQAVVSRFGTRIGGGTVIMANAVVNPGTTIGMHCIINSAAVVEHDNWIDDYAHVSVGAKLAGTVHIGKRTWIGIGAVVINDTSVCADCMIGAGGVVTQSIAKPGTYVGVPVRRIS